MKKPSKINQFNNNLSVAKEEREIPSVGVPADLALDELHIENCLKRGQVIAEDIGKTLAKIQQEKLFPEKTFELYVKRRWSHNRDWAYKMIQGYKNVLNLIQTSVDIKQLSSESQVSELSKAPKEKQEEILKEVAKEGKITAKKIAEKVKQKAEPKDAEFRVVVKDFNDEEVPEEIADEFQRAEREAKEHINHAQGIKNYLERDDFTTVEARGLRETAKDLLAGLKTHLSKHVLCPVCHGDKCTTCSKRGFVSNHFATKGIGNKKK